MSDASAGESECQRSGNRSIEREAPAPLHDFQCLDYFCFLPECVRQGFLFMDRRVGTELCLVPVAFAVLKRWKAPISVDWGEIPCVGKVSFGVEGMRFTWQARHFVDVRSSLMCVLCGRCIELMNWAFSLTCCVPCAAFKVHFCTVSLRNHSRSRMLWHLLLF